MTKEFPFKTYNKAQETLLLPLNKNIVKIIKGSTIKFTNSIYTKLLSKLNKINILLLAKQAEEYITIPSI